MLNKIRVRSYEKALLFKDGELKDVLGEGVRWLVDPLKRYDVELYSKRNPWMKSENLDLLARSDELKDELEIVELNQSQRALVWIDGRFDRVLAPGRYALWTQYVKVRVDICDISESLIERQDISDFLATAASQMQSVRVDECYAGVFYRNGKYERTLGSGLYALWNGGHGKVKLVDLREQLVDVSGQEMMTSDRVTLRVNAVVTYRTVDARKAVEATSDVEKALYREVQLGLRASIGSRSLDDLLAEKMVVTDELKKGLSAWAVEFGVEILSVGIRDIILPGDMKVLMNKVIEARKVSEANVISRREETAAMRSQLNTAKLLESNPALMRLRELETLEAVAANSKLNVVLGEKGLADRLVNLL